MATIAVSFITAISKLSASTPKRVCNGHVLTYRLPPLNEGSSPSLLRKILIVAEMSAAPSSSLSTNSSSPARIASVAIWWAGKNALALWRAKNSLASLTFSGLSFRGSKIRISGLNAFFFRIASVFSRDRTPASRYLSPEMQPRSGRLSTTPNSPSCASFSAGLTAKCVSRQGPGTARRCLYAVRCSRCAMSTGVYTSPASPRRYDAL